MRIDMYPEKAQYLLKEPIILIAELDLVLGKVYRGVLTITHLQNKIIEQEYELEDRINRLEIGGLDSDFAGYGAELQVYCEDKLLTVCHTAFDVVSECKKAIRYGFLSDFNDEKGEDCNDIRNLRKYHINYVQYYDWSYRHDNLVSDESVYKDMMGREVNLDIVKKKIATCKEFGMKSMGYGAIYAASKDFYEKNKESALYTSAGDPLVFIDTFYIMNIARESNWRRHIIEEYAKAIGDVGFDGIHMDTYGFPKTAFSFNKSLIKMDQEYPGLILDTKKRLDEITEENHLIFNNVGNWPVRTIAKSPQDAVYIEVWDPYVTYGHIKQIIRDARRECGDQKPVILAAYLEPFRTENEEHAAYASYLLTAAITVNGAYHLLLGEENGVLTQGYYVDHTIINADTRKKLRTYYDFLVQYMELFYDKELTDVSMTHLGWDNTEYLCNNNRWSVDAEADKVWLTVKEKDNRKLISLINLCGITNNEWNKGKERPEKQIDIELQVQIDQEVKGIYFISPDYNFGKVQELEYTKIHTDRGWAVKFTVPKLEFWSNVWIDF